MDAELSAFKLKLSPLFSCPFRGFGSRFENRNNRLLPRECEGQSSILLLHRTRGDLNTGRREQEGGERSEVMTLSGDRTKEERPSQTRNLIHNVLSPLQSIKSELEIIRVASMQWDSVSAQRAIRALGRRVSKGLPFRDQAQAHPTMM